MKTNILKYACLLGLSCAVAFCLEGKTTYVKGHFRNGKYVRPHVRHTNGGTSFKGGGVSSGVSASGWSGGESEGLPMSARVISPDCSDEETREVFESCKAVYDNGRRCNCWTEDGKLYCAEHRDFDARHKPKWQETLTSNSDLARSSETVEKLERIRRAVDYYSDRVEGALPSDEKTFRALVPTYMVPPSKDAWGRTFEYMLNSEGLDVRSAGPDAQFGTKDDLVLLMER